MSEINPKNKQSIILNNHPINDYQQSMWPMHPHQSKIILKSKQNGRKRNRWRDDH